MEFEWHDEKEEKNKLKHGLSFSYAALIFKNPRVIFKDERKDYQETRYISIGEINNDILTVVHTHRGNLIRLISARFATKKERHLWHLFVKA
jgi:uncharacterized protein